jgi:hypothetical protein
MVTKAGDSLPPRYRSSQRYDVCDMNGKSKNHLAILQPTIVGLFARNRLLSYLVTMVKTSKLRGQEVYGVIKNLK